MRRLSTELPFTCVTCEQEIRGRVVFHVGLPFCCAGCVANGPCLCSYDEPDALKAPSEDPGISRLPAAAAQPVAAQPVAARQAAAQEELTLAVR